MTTWDLRSRVAADHEQHVADELRRRGYRVEPWGLGTFRPVCKAMIQACDSPLRYLPDLIAAPRNQPHRAVLIDCKAQLRDAADERAIEQDCADAGLALAAAARLPIWYVFSDLAVSSPQDVLATGRLTPPGPNGSGSFYYRVPRALDRDFDAVFGGLPAQQLVLLPAA